MTGNYTLVRLRDAIDQSGEDAVLRVLSTFLCPINEDIQLFLHKKAVQFCNMGVAQTHLVFASYRDELVLVGYFALALKSLTIPLANISKTTRKAVNKFAVYNRDNNSYQCPAILIGQLGKNYANGYNKLISGDDLLAIALGEVKKAQMIIGGKMVYLECEHKNRLVEFYERNGFRQFGRRELDRDENGLSGEYLLQLLRFM